jgi:hypothetical protein
MKNMNLQWHGALFLLVAIVSQSCTTFKPITRQPKRSQEIAGIYSNDFDSTSSWYKEKLWQIIQPKKAPKEDSLQVRFEITPKNKLKAQLLKNDSIIAEKIIKGEFREDQCYYVRRRFFIIPILPVLFMYSNEQVRIYAVDKTLVFEKAYNKGGAVIIMAGGSEGTYTWLYPKR